MFNFTQRSPEQPDTEHTQFFSMLRAQIYVSKICLIMMFLSKPPAFTPSFPQTDAQGQQCSLGDPIIYHTDGSPVFSLRLRLSLGTSFAFKCLSHDAPWKARQGEQNL